MKKILIQVQFLYLLVHTCSSQIIDHSPYCEQLARVTNLCTEWFIHVLCPKTCQIESMLTKTCGKGKAQENDFQGMRKKRFDQQLQNGFQYNKQQQNTDLEHNRARRVVGGSPSVKGAFPWHVALYYNGQLRCAGAILSPDWIITAAHCFNELRATPGDPVQWMAVSGEHTLLVDERTEEKSTVKKIIFHSRYHKYTARPGEKDRPDDYDIALIKLEKPIKFNADISPVCISDDLNRFSLEDDCRVMGWATSATDGWYQKTLHEAKAKLVPIDLCNLPISYNGTIHKRAICAAYSDGSADACDNDSGGSLVCNKNQRWYSVGLISFGYQCGSPKTYGVFTNVPMMKGWIVETILGYDDSTNSTVSILERIAALSPQKNPIGGFEKK